MCIFIFLNIFYIYLLFIHSDSINLEFLYLKVVTFVETRRTNLRVPCVVHVQPASFPPLVSCVWRQNCCWFSWSHTGRTVYCVSFVFFLLFTRSTPTLTWSHPNNTYCPLLPPTAPCVLNPRVRQSRLVLVRCPGVDCVERPVSPYCNCRVFFWGITVSFPPTDGAVDDCICDICQKPTLMPSITFLQQQFDHKD